MNESSNGKKLMVGTGIYAVGTFGTRILMFLIAPLYTYYLAPSEMGTYDVLMSTISLLMPIISLQISDAVYRWIIQDQTDCALYLRVTNQFLLFGSMISIAITLIVNRFIEIPYVLYFLASLISALFFQINQKILRGLKRQWLFAISGIVYTSVFLVLNIIQLCVLHKGVESLMMSYIVANIVAYATILAFEKRLRVNLFNRADLQTFKQLVGYSIPLIPNYLSWWIVDSSDKYIVLFFLGISSNGILAIAHKFPTMLQSIFGLFINSWQDLAISSEKADKAFFSSVFNTMYRLSFSLMWVVLPVTKLFVWLVMGKDYKIACDYIPFYYLGAVFQAFCSFYGVGYLRRKETQKAFSSSVYGAVINAAVNISMIKFVGLQAAAISTCVAFLIMWLIREKHNREELGIKFRWLDFSTLLALDIFCCVISILGSIKINVMLFVIGAISFCLFSRKDLLSIVGLIRTRKQRN